MSLDKVIQLSIFLTKWWSKKFAKAAIPDPSDSKEVRSFTQTGTQFYSPVLFLVSDIFFPENNILFG